MHQLSHADQGGLILLQMAHVDLAGDILLGSHAEHAGQRLGRGGINRQHTGTGILAAHRAAVAHAVHIHVVGVLAVALHLLLHVQTVDAAAQFPVIGAGSGDFPLAEDLRRQQNAVDDLYIAGAAADVVADGKGRLLAGGVGIYIQQALGGDHHAGDAETALNRARLAEGEGKDLLLPVAEALHRDNGLALQLVRLGNAGLGGLAVNENVAGAAGALAASVLHRGEVQLVPQKADQLLIFFHRYGAAVYDKCCHMLRSSLPPWGGQKRIMPLYLKIFLYYTIFFSFPQELYVKIVILLFR